MKTKTISKLIKGDKLYRYDKYYKLSSSEIQFIRKEKDRILIGTLDFFQMFLKEDFDKTVINSIATDCVFGTDYEETREEADKKLMNEFNEKFQMLVDQYKEKFYNLENEILRT